MCVPLLGCFAMIQAVAVHPLPLTSMLVLVPMHVLFAWGERYFNTIRIDGLSVTAPMQGFRLGWSGTVQRSTICPIRSSRRTLLNRLVGQTLIRTRDGKRLVVNHSSYDAAERQRILVALGVLQPPPQR